MSYFSQYHNYMSAKDIENQILNQISLSDYIGNYVALVQKGNSYKGLCPFHQDTTPSFSVNNTRRLFKCFSCDKAGSLIQFVALRDEIPYQDATSVLAKEFNIEYQVYRDPEAVFNEEQIKAMEANRAAQGYFKKSFLKANAMQSELSAFIKKRQLSEDIIEYFELGFDDGKLSEWIVKRKVVSEPFENLGLIKERYQGAYNDINFNRLMIPIYDRFNNLVGFGARAINDQQSPKYINSSDNLIFSKHKLLYNYQRAISEAKNKNQMILVEGYFDVFGMHKLGYPNTVAIMGTALAEEQLKLLKNLEIILFLDNDQAGINATIKQILFLLKHNFRVSVMLNNLSKNLVKQGKNDELYDVIFKEVDAELKLIKEDADDISKRENGKEIIDQIYQNRQSGIDFIYRHLRRKYSFNDSASVTDFINEFNQYIQYENENIINRYNQLLNDKYVLGVNFKAAPKAKNNYENKTLNNSYQTRQNDYVPQFENPEHYNYELEHVPSQNDNFEPQNNKQKFNDIQTTIINLPNKINQRTQVNNALSRAFVLILQNQELLEYFKSYKYKKVCEDYVTGENLSLMKIIGFVADRKSDEDYSFSELLKQLNNASNENFISLFNKINSIMNDMDKFILNKKFSKESFARYLNHYLKLYIMQRRDDESQEAAEIVKARVKAESDENLKIQLNQRLNIIYNEMAQLTSIINEIEADTQSLKKS